MFVVRQAALYRTRRWWSSLSLLHLIFLYDQYEETISFLFIIPYVFVPVQYHFTIHKKIPAHDGRGKYQFV